VSAELNTFFHTDATVPANAPSYVEREADKHLLEGLSKGEFCYVLTASQMGKSSLMVRTAARLRADGIHAIVLDLTNIGTNVTPEQWYYGLVNAMGRLLGLEDELDDFWFDQERLGPVQRMLGAIRDIVLPSLKTGAANKMPGAGTSELEAQSRLVIFVDEINVVRGLPFNADDFFTAIQCCYQRRIDDPEFKRVAFCLIGIATPSDLIRDKHATTPFNIGRRIEMTDFAPENASALARGLEGGASAAPRSSAEAQQLLDRVLYWTHGHPYLTQRLCRALVSKPELREPNDVDQLCEEVFFSSRAREQDPNLLFVRDRILGTELRLGQVLNLYTRIWNGETVPDDDTNRVIDVLRLSGVVRIEKGALVVRNRIYHRVFNAEWVRANLPQEGRADPSSIAVLPFRLIGPDRSYEYLADGLTDELISALGRVAGLRVASRTSVYHYKEKSEDVRKIGEQLMVHNLLEGSVRQAGITVQISAQLVHGNNGHCVWSETYQYTQKTLLEIQDKIAGAILSRLKPRAAAVARPVENTEAYNLYLKGRFYWNRRTETAVRRSIELFQEAIQKDPGSSLAYAGLADAFMILATYNYAQPLDAYPRAKEAAVHALELDESLAQAHSALACVSSVHDWNWVKAEAEFRRAIELNPSYATAHQWYANHCLTPLGRHEEAIAELRCAQDVDPLSISIAASIGLALYFAGRFEEAVQQCRQAVEMDPTFWIGQLFLGWACIQQGQFEDAVTALQASLSFGNKDPVALAALAHAYGIMDRRTEALQIVAQLDQLARTRYVPAMDLVPVHLALNDTEAALRGLESALAERSFKLIYLKVDPRLQKLHADPQFAALEKRVGLVKESPCVGL
jgi:TolB-like protein/Tfp pilus assembly protein PilF